MYAATPTPPIDINTGQSLAWRRSCHDDKKGVPTVICKRFRLRFLFGSGAGYNDHIGAIIVVFDMLVVVIDEHVILPELWSR